MPYWPFQMPMAPPTCLVTVKVPTSELEGASPSVPLRPLELRVPVSMSGAPGSLSGTRDAVTVVPETE